MSSAQELKRRIKSVSSTEQVARAMRTAAVSKYTRTHKKAQDFAPYRDACMTLLNRLGDGGDTAERQGKACFVAITAERGLCGKYNEELFKFLRQTLEEEQGEKCVILCGKWGIDRAAAGGLEDVLETFPLEGVPGYENALALYRRLRALWDGGEVSRVAFVYQDFKNILVQTPVCRQLLPVPPEAAEAGEAERELICVPDRKSILPPLREQCLAAQVYGILLTAAEGAHGAMLTAMRTAADNSKEMLAALEQELNRLRQSAVTTEVIEISGGVAAGQNEGTEI